MATRGKKSPAEKRTIDLFTGMTQEQVDKEQIAQAEVDAPEQPKAQETIEQASERWRTNAFEAAEHLSKSFHKPPEELLEKGTYRITVKGPMMFLEQFRHGKTGGTYGWTGLMWPSGDLYELTSVFVKASKEKNSKEKAKEENNGS